MLALDLIVPILYVLFVWWFSTGAILFLDGLPRRTYPITLIAATALLGLALAGVSRTADVVTLGAAYSAFTCGLLAWGWNEIAFLLGYTAGPRCSSCPDRVTPWRRFWLATCTILYHEIVIALTCGVLVWLTWDKPNKVGLWTFAILWGMRLSTKLNLFLGARNLSESFLPPHLEYLKTYFLRRPINFLFPVSVTGGTVLLTLLVMAACDPTLPRAETAGLVFLATLTALGVLEHWFLMMPFSSETLWRWGLISHTQLRESLAQSGRGQSLKGDATMTSDASKLQMSGRIGPNSIIQVYNAMGEQTAEEDRRAVFEKAGLAHYLDKLPEKMIPETEVIALHKALRERLPAEVCDRIMARAGETTADYLLANRIPKAVSAVLKRLPAGAAAWVLLNAISRNAWTFTGTGRFSWKSGAPWRLIVEDSPLCRGETCEGPMCVYYAATFEKLFKVLVSPNATVSETSCGSRGGAACEFSATW